MSIYEKFNPQPILFNLDDWQEVLSKSIKERSHFNITSNQLNFGQLAVQFLGSYTDEDEYFNMLYDLKNSTKVKIHALSEEFDKTISIEQMQNLTNTINICQKENVSVNRLVAFLKGYNLIPLVDKPDIHRYIQLTLIDVLKTFQTKNQQGFASPDFRRTIIDLVKLLWNHIDKWFKETPIDEGMPKIMWYGDATKSKVYCLYFLIKLGCDCIIFHPEKKDILTEVKDDLTNLFKHEFPLETPIEPFPLEKRDRVSTVAHRASVEYSRVLNGEDTGFFKPWQLRDYIPNAITLKTTYDEIFIIAKAKAFIRPNFEVKRGHVQIPSIFSKIAGVSSDKKEYWSRLQELTKSNLSLPIRHFPFTTSVKANYLYHYQQCIGTDGKLSAEKIMHGNWWQYKHLPTGLQRGIAEAIIRCCSSPRLKPLPQESKHDLQIYIFKHSFAIPEEILKLLIKFDYPQDVPKLILFNTEKNGELSRSDACLLLLLNELGMDVIVYNPPGYNDIENYIEDGVYDIHWLEEMCFEQEFKEETSKSILSGFKKLLNLV